MPGSPMSSTHATGRSRRAAASPASPSVSTCTPKPSRVRYSRTRSAIGRSSSTTSTSPREVGSLTRQRATPSGQRRVRVRYGRGQPTSSTTVPRWPTCRRLAGVPGGPSAASRAIRRSVRTPRLTPVITGRAQSGGRSARAGRTAQHVPLQLTGCRRGWWRRSSPPPACSRWPPCSSNGVPRWSSPRSPPPRLAVYGLRDLLARERLRVDADGVDRGARLRRRRPARLGPDRAGTGRRTAAARRAHPAARGRRRRLRSTCSAASTSAPIPSAVAEPRIDAVRPRSLHHRAPSGPGLEAAGGTGAGRLIGRGLRDQPAAVSSDQQQRPRPCRPGPGCGSPCGGVGQRHGEDRAGDQPAEVRREEMPGTENEKTRLITSTVMIAEVSRFRPPEHDEQRGEQAEDRAGRAGGLAGGREHVAGDAAAEPGHQVERRRTAADRARASSSRPSTHSAHMFSARWSSP